MQKFDPKALQLELPVSSADLISHNSLNLSKQTNDSESTSTPDDKTKTQNAKKTPKPQNQKKPQSAETTHSKTSPDKETESENGNSRRKTCEICCDQMLLVSNTTHFYTHARSDFVAQLMKKFYTKSSNIKMINCRECLKNPNAVKFEGKRFSATFNHMFTFKHLCDNHIVEFKGHEKEVLKYINFFSMIHKVDKAHNNIIESFQFTYPQMIELSEIYFSLTSEEQARKQLIMGKLYHQLQQDIEAKGLKPNINPQTKKQIELYLKADKKIPNAPVKNPETNQKALKEIQQPMTISPSKFHHHNEAVSGILAGEKIKLDVIPIKHEFQTQNNNINKVLPSSNPSSENLPSNRLKRNPTEDLPYEEKVKKIKSSFDSNPIDTADRGYNTEPQPQPQPQAQARTVTGFEKEGGYMMNHPMNSHLFHRNMMHQQPQPQLQQYKIFSQIQIDQNSLWEMIVQSDALNKKMKEKMTEITEKMKNSEFLNQHLIQKNQRLEAENGMLREQLRQNEDRTFYTKLELKKETD